MTDQHQRVLIIDDDTSLLWLLKQALKQAGYDVSLAPSGVDGLKEMYQTHPNIVVLDVMMPVMDGWEVCRRIRELSDVPIIMLTAKSEEADKIRGFELGVDDYVTKPFSFAELISRIRAVLHRAGAEPASRRPRLYSGKGLIIDVGARRVLRHGEPVQLTPTEFRLLVALAEGHGYTVPTETLLARVWGEEYTGEPEHVKRYVWRLRSKIEEDPLNPQVIITERGLGYRLALED